MVRKTKFKIRNTLFVFILASLFIHLMFFVSLPSLQEEIPEDITVIELDKMDFDTKKQRQVVETAKADNNKLDKNAKFLGQRNQKVEKQQVAKRVDSFRDKKSGGPNSVSLKDLIPKMNLSKPLDAGEFERKKQRQLQKMARAQMAASNDFLKDQKIAEGDQTLLSTQEFIYFGYYHRIRKKLEQSWNRRLRDVLGGYFRNGQRLMRKNNYVTRVIVTLDRNGVIRKVELLEQSGKTDLDDAAVDAFNAAGPFPNPPKGLIDKSGFVRITWGFVVQS